MSKATFGATATEVSTDALKDTRPPREELGAIWERESASTKKNYMNIVFTLKKAQLLELIENSPLDADGKVKMGFVAFENEGRGDNPKRPKYRIFKDFRGTSSNSPSKPVAASTDVKVATD